MVLALAAIIWYANTRALTQETKIDYPKAPTQTIEVVFFGHTKDTLHLDFSGEPYIVEDETGQRVLAVPGVGVVASNVRKFKIIK